MSETMVKLAVIGIALGLVTIGFWIGAFHMNHRMQVQAVKAGVGEYDENSEFRWKTVK